MKETLLQAVGRGRGVTDKAVPVVVASCESLGLPIADSPLQKIGDSEDETLQLMVTASVTKNLSNLSDKNAKYITIGDLSDALIPDSEVQSEVTTSELAKMSHYDERTVRRHLSTLSLPGCLAEGAARRMDSCKLAINSASDQTRTP